MGGKHGNGELSRDRRQEIQGMAETVTGIEDGTIGPIEGDVPRAYL